MRRLRGFDARIIYHNRKRDLNAERELNATYVTFNSLLEQSDFIICSLDVMRQEPIQPDHPILKLPNAVVLPHIGSSSQVTRNRMVQLCIDNIKADNDAPLTPVTLYTLKFIHVSHIPSIECDNVNFYLIKQQFCYIHCNCLIMALELK